MIVCIVKDIFLSDKATENFLFSSTFMSFSSLIWFSGRQTLFFNLISNNNRQLFSSVHYLLQIADQKQNDMGKRPTIGLWDGNKQHSYRSISAGCALNFIQWWHLHFDVRFVLNRGVRVFSQCLSAQETLLRATHISRILLDRKLDWTKLDQTDHCQVLEKTWSQRPGLLMYVCLVFILSNYLFCHYLLCTFGNQTLKQILCLCAQILNLMTTMWKLPVSTPQWGPYFTGHQSITGPLYRDRHTFALSFTLMGNKSPQSTKCMSLDCGKKLEYS